MGPAILMSLTGLSAGILFATGIPGRNRLLFALPLLLTLAVLVYRNSRSVRPVLKSLMPVLPGFPLFFLAGWLSVGTTLFDPDPIPEGPVTLTGRIVSYQVMSEKSARLVVKITSLSLSDSLMPVHGRIVLILRPEPAATFNPGEWWWFGPVRLKSITDQPTPNGFVPSRYWLSKGIRCEAWLPSGKAGRIRPAGFIGPGRIFSRWQSTLSGRIDRMPLSPESRSLIQAMVVGDRSGVDDNLLNDFSKAGIIHVLSVSGLHVGIVYLVIVTLLKIIRFIGPSLRSAIAMTGVLVYAGLTGFCPSVLRASGMILLFGVAGISRRGTGGFAILGAMALIHFLIDPYALFNPGAQLSYLAVAGILMWNPVITRMQQGTNRIARYLVSAIGISLAAQLLLIPVMLFWFRQFPLYFLAGNLALLPILVLCFYLGLGMVLLFMAGIWIQPAGRVVDLLVLVSVKGASWLGNLPGNMFAPSGLCWPDLVLYYFIALSIRAFVKRPDQQVLRRMLIAALLLTGVRFLWKLTG